MFDFASLYVVYDLSHSKNVSVDAVLFANLKNVVDKFVLVLLGEFLEFLRAHFV